MASPRSDLRPNNLAGLGRRRSCKRQLASFVRALSPEYVPIVIASFTCESINLRACLSLVYVSVSRTHPAGKHKGVACRKVHGPRLRLRDTGLRSRRQSPPIQKRQRRTRPQQIEEVGQPWTQLVRTRPLTETSGGRRGEAGEARRLCCSRRLRGRLVENATQSDARGGARPKVGTQGGGPSRT